MQNSDDQVQALRAELARLERIGTRRQWFLFTALGASICIGLMGASPDEKTASFDSLTCREFKVLDKDGNCRIRASINDKAMATLTLQSPSGSPRVMLMDLPEKGAGITLLDQEGKIRIVASTSKNGSGEIALNDANQKARIVAGTDASGTARIVWWDGDGKMRIDLGTYELSRGAEFAALTYTSKDGKTLQMEGIGPDGKLLHRP